MTDDDRWERHRAATIARLKRDALARGAPVCECGVPLGETTAYINGVRTRLAPSCVACGKIGPKPTEVPR